EPARPVVDQGGRLLDDRVGGDHLPRDEVVSDTEMFQGPLGLRSPELLGRHIHRPETIVFNARDSHDRNHVFDEDRASVYSPSAVEIAAVKGILRKPSRATSLFRFKLYAHSSFRDDWARIGTRCVAPFHRSTSQLGWRWPDRGTR